MEENNLISKKEILEQTGISYGQLYRWKRKSLIPEAWFIKKASFTGQETYFPREKILERIHKIIDMKEDLSLDDLAEMFSPALIKVDYSSEELEQSNIVTKAGRTLYENIKGKKETYEFKDILFITLLEKLVSTDKVTLEEGISLLEVLEKCYDKQQDKTWEAVLLRKYGMGLWIVTPAGTELYTDTTAKLVYRLKVNKEIEELKVKLQKND